MNIKKNINDLSIKYIMCDDFGSFVCYGSIEDLCTLFAYITYRLLKKGINIKYLITSMCNANDLYNNLK